MRSGEAQESDSDRSIASPTQWRGPWPDQQPELFGDADMAETENWSYSYRT
jgi:hypothetical protein